MRTTSWGGYRWLIPILIFLLTIELIPFCLMLYNSFHSISYTQPSKRGQFIAFENYRKAVHDEEFIHSIGLTLLFMAVSLPVEFVLGLAIATLLFYHIKLKKYLLPLILIPMIISPIVIGLTARLNLSPDFGLVGIFLKSLGLAEQGLLGSTATAFWTVVAADVWQWTPFLILIFLAAILSIPKEPFEAAAVDGANRWQQFTKIIVPMLQPIFIVGLLLRLTDAFRMFDKLFIMTGGGPGNSTELLTIYAYRVNFRSWNLGYGAAVVSILFFISFTLTFIFLRTTERLTGSKV